MEATGARTASLVPTLMHKDTAVRALDGAQLNYVAELPETEIVDDSGLKSIVDGTSNITGKYLYADSYTFRPRAGHVMCSNTLIAVKSRTAAFWRRWIVLPFTRAFVSSDGEALAGHDASVERGSLGELPGIVTKLILAACEALAQRSLPRVKASSEALAQWKLDASQVRQWLDTEAEIVDTPAGECRDWTPARRIVTAQQMWAAGGGYQKIGEHKLLAELRTLGAKRHRKTDGWYYSIRTRVLLQVPALNPAPAPQRSPVPPLPELRASLVREAAQAKVSLTDKQLDQFATLWARQWPLPLTPEQQQDVLDPRDSSG
jgi:hypothetical protein